MLLLIRHGETPLNVARVLQPADTPLSARGLAQARALAARLAAPGDWGPRVAGVLASDLPRARQTAAAVAAACRVAVQLEPLLQERNFGDLRGQPYDALGHDPLAAADAPPGGESQADFAARCDRAWARLCQVQARLGGPLAVVSHGLVLREWLQRHVALPADARLPARLANTSLSWVDAAPPHAARAIDCTRHLNGPSPFEHPIGDTATGLHGG